jgi:hypothetical protein
MEKKLKDYLHLYLGCEFLYANNPLPFTLKGFQPNKSTSKNPADEYQLICVDADGQWDEMPLDEHFKLTLRPLSEILSIPIGQKRQLLDAGLMYSHAGDEYTIWTPEATRLACSFGIDLFGLIDAGVAIYATKQEVKP